MSGLAAGELNRRIKIEKKDVVRNPLNGRDTITWSVRATVWAAKRDLSGKEQLLANQIIPTSMAEFKIRWRTDVIEGDRIRCDGQTYDIQHIAEIGQRDGVRILAKLPDAS